jgi:ADP-heptose:LPS heptosyltransferase
MTPNFIANYDCRYFNGYKPCKYMRLCRDCPYYDPPSPRVLLINLHALGDVLRTTALLPKIRRKYPEAFITWLTMPASKALLQGNPLIDQILYWNPEILEGLRAREFDILLNVDKAVESCGLAMSIEAFDKRGFGLNRFGTITQLNPEADYLYYLGLDDEEKFFKNKKSELQLLAEAFGFEYQPDEYSLELDPEEKAMARRFREAVPIASDEIAVGINTGCSNLYPFKRWRPEYQAKIADRIQQEISGTQVLLLGGKEDTERNRTIQKIAKTTVIPTPTAQGLRNGIIFEDACDVIVSGDSLGMHLAIGLKKEVVAWFGLSCAQEIELFGRGTKLKADVKCGPCWKRYCDNDPLCVDSIDPDEVIAAVKTSVERVREQRSA